MKVVCRKALSCTTGEDLGERSPWLKPGREYIVLAMSVSLNSGNQIYIQCEHYHEPSYFSLNGFEILDQRIPSSWILSLEGKPKYLFDSLYVGPASWNYPDFEEELDDGKLGTYELFVAEAKKIYDELGEKMPPYEYSGSAVLVSSSDSDEKLMRAFGYDPNDEKQVEAWRLLMESDDEKKS